MAERTRQEKQNQPDGFPHSLDLTYIRTIIPIETVWAELAEEVPALNMEPVRNHATRCPWHDDQTPSFHFAKNNKCKCHVCDVGMYYSNLDLVMKVLQCDIGKAVRWFQSHWDIPLARAGRPAGSHGSAKPYRVGFGGALETIIRSGLYGELSRSARLLLPVLAAVLDERKEIDWTYDSLMAASGIRKRSDITEAIKELQTFHILSPARKFFAPGSNKTRCAYKLTLDNPDLAKRIDLAYGAHRFANEQARAYRAQTRKLRSHSKKQDTPKEKDYT